MEFNYSLIEKKFSEYILKLIGPSEEQNKIRESKFQKIKNIFERIFEEQGITAHIFSFGSYPIKTYLPESDIDITIIIEDSSTGKIIPVTSPDYQNKIFNLIQFALEKHNNEVGFPQITDINLIPAELKLIKCKFDSLAFDISINNFVGVCKLAFIHQLESNTLNSELFKRSLFLIKCWGYYEASILGSNVGLMASYALEVLIIYMFNNHSHLFTNEIEAVFAFFQLMHTMDWNKSIITIFGEIGLDDYFENLKANQYNIYSLIKNILNENNKEKDKHTLIKLDELISINKNFEKFYDKSQNPIRKVIDIKLLNVIDPLFPTNNLGKSLNYHNFSKIKKVFEFSAHEAADLIKRKKEKTIAPIDYLNSVMKFFNKIITMNNPELFYMSLPQPKIIIFPRDNFLSDEDEVDLNEIKKQSDFKLRSSGFLPNNLNEELIVNFNKTFVSGIDSECSHIVNNERKNSINNGTGNTDNSQGLLSDFVWPSNYEIKNEVELNKLHNKYLSHQNLYVTKSVIEFFINKTDNKEYSLLTSDEVKLTEDYLNYCSFS